MREFRRQLGDEWSVSLVEANALDFGLPQSRSRVFIVGRRKELYPWGVPSGLPCFARSVSVGQCLAQPEHMLSVRAYTDVQQRNVERWRAVSRSLLQNPENKGKYIIFPADRDPTLRTVWSTSTPTLDRCPCLTRSGPMLHILACGHGPNPPVDRPLQPFEHGLMQGFPVALCAKMVQDPVNALHAFGNAMAVPVIGAVIAQEIVCMIRQIGGIGITSFLTRYIGVPKWPLHHCDPGSPPLGAIDGGIGVLSEAVELRGVTGVSVEVRRAGEVGGRGRKSIWGEPLEGVPAKGSKPVPEPAAETFSGYVRPPSRSQPFCMSGWCAVRGLCGISPFSDVRCNPRSASPWECTQFSSHMLPVDFPGSCSAGPFGDQLSGHG